MAFTCGFFNSQNGDRKYNAEQISAIFDGLIKDGVYDTVGQMFAVTAGTGMQVLVGSGRAWFDHTWNNNDAQYPLAITAADVSLKRYDTVVLETNHSDSVRTNRLRVVTGTPASNPSKPTLTNTTNVKQHALAHILIPAGATAITASMITVVVGTSECPFVTGIIQTASIDALFNQWNGEFDEWFENLKSVLSDNVVANLQKQIDEAKLAAYTIVNDTTASAVGVSAKSNLDTTIQKMMSTISLIQAGLGTVTVTVKTAAGHVVPNVLVGGVKTAAGGVVYTNSSGVASGYANAGSTTFSVTGYADIADKTQTATITAGKANSVAMTVTTVTFKSFTASTNIKFSGNVSSVAVSLGGGGGAGGIGYYAASGGGGGYVTTRTGISVSANTSYPIVIGAGGASGTRDKSFNIGSGHVKGGTGGTTSVFGITAAGGTGGDGWTYATTAPAGNGNGGYTGGTGLSANGANGTAVVYSSFTATTAYGGGGGAMDADGDDVNWHNGGTPGGGQGNYFASGSSSLYDTPDKYGDGKNGLGGGGGGGYNISNNGRVGNGGSGYAAIRITLKGA